MYSVPINPFKAWEGVIKLNKSKSKRPRPAE